jgi:hypothetical protein
MFTNLCVRLILSNTEDLHAKIDELTERIHELEEALASLQVVPDYLSISNPAIWPFTHRPSQGATF